MLVARASAPYGNLKEFIEFARRQGKPLYYGTWGNGSTAHLFGELLKRQTDVPLTHVAYKGSVAAIAVLPDERPVELGNYQEMGAPRCYLRVRDKQGNQVKPMDFVPLLGSAYCRAIDLKIDRESGRMQVLLERESGDETVWWAGELTAWGKGLKNIGIGTVGDTALALAARPNVTAVCGTRAVANEVDKLDALAVLLRPGEPAEARVFDYLPGGDPNLAHTFTETARDCAFADDTLVLVTSEMGRMPKVGDRRSGGPLGAGRDHWTSCMSVLMAGAGIKGGQVIGETDARAEYPKDRPIYPEDVTKTVYYAMGIDNLDAKDRLGGLALLLLLACAVRHKAGLS